MTHISAEEQTTLPSPLDSLPLSRRLVADVSAVLHKHGIPAVLWGTWLLKLHGVPSVVSDVEFVVPDALASKAANALLTAGALPCPDPACCDLTSQRGSFPPPAAHVHLQMEEGVLLFAKSKTLWAVPSLDLQQPSASPADIVLASDPSLPPARLGGGSGPYESFLPPVRAPSVHRLTEAFILLKLRDRATRYLSFWDAMLTYMEEYAFDRGYLDIDLLRTHHRQYLVDLAEGNETVREIIDKLERGEKATPTPAYT